MDYLCEPSLITQALKSRELSLVRVRKMWQKEDGDLNYEKDWMCRCWFEDDVGWRQVLSGKQVPLKPGERLPAESKKTETSVLHPHRTEFCQQPE